MNNFARTYKVLLVGDMAVGKTSIMKRYIHDEFNDDYKSTIGVDFLTTKTKIKDLEVKLVIWDVCGQSKWADFRKHYYLGTQVLLIVFDVTRERSFKNSYGWLLDYAQFMNVKNTVIFLVGNKNDLQFSIDQDIFKIYMGYFNQTSLEIPYVNTSAKTGENINELFGDAIKKLLLKEMKQSNETSREKTSTKTPVLESTKRPSP